MDNGKISVRYARALLNTAFELHCEQEVYEGLTRLTANYSLAMQPFYEALSNPTVSADDKVGLLLTATGTPIHPCLEHFYRFVTEKNRVNRIYLIALQYQEMYRDKKNILHAEVTTATALDDSTLEKIRDYLHDTFHSDIEMQVKVDPALIGGFTLNLENDRMDASLAGRLKQLKEELGVRNKERRITP